MSAPWHLIEEKAEDAVMSALLTEYGGTRSSTSGLISGGSFDGCYMFKGFDLMDIQLPFIGIVCDESEPAESALATPTGNQRVKVTLSFRSQHNDATRAAHSANAARIRDFCYASNLVTLLNAEGVTDFTATYTYPDKATRGVDDGQMVTSIDLMISCKPS